MLHGVWHWVLRVYPSLQLNESIFIAPSCKAWNDRFVSLSQYFPRDMYISNLLPRCGGGAVVLMGLCWRWTFVITLGYIELFCKDVGSYSTCLKYPLSMGTFVWKGSKILCWENSNQVWIIPSAHRTQVLKTPFNIEIILHSSSFDPAILDFVVHMVSTKNTQMLLRLSIILRIGVREISAFWREIL